MSAKVIDIAEARRRLRGPVRDGGWHDPLLSREDFASLLDDAKGVADQGPGWAPTPMTIDELRADIEHGCEQLLKIVHASWCPRHENLDTNCRCDPDAS